MFDPMRLAHPVQAMRPARLPGGFPFFVHGKPIGKRAIIIGQERMDLVRKRGQKLFDGLRHRGSGAPGQHFDPHIARGAINGHQHITGLLL